MEQESLDKLSHKIFKVIDKLDIDTVDKMDFLINLKTLLEDKETYEKSIKVLQREMPRKKRF